MEDQIVQLMKLDKELIAKFTETELDEFLSILISLLKVYDRKVKL